ncbi:DNA glycosylase [Crassisporium funariophilum]|nr:DNA glycosylase [Crassisporium funariophilum]
MDLEDLKSSPLNSSDNNAIASTTRTTKLESETSSTSTPKKSKSDVKSSPKKIKAIPQTLATPHPAPSNWRETYDAIKAMRSQFVAPVDTMGCDQAQWKESDPKNRRYATLVSLMLSSQTKDEVTDAAVSKLREALGGSLTVQGMIEAEDAVISEAIAKVGFWRRKTGYLKQAAVKLRDDFASDVPKTVDELCSLPGVGPKMAFLALQIAWNLNHGIGVDVHVHRITNLLGWHKPPTKTPEQTRLNLQSWLPKELHGDINHMLVGFGQVVCLPVGPRCDVCDLSKKGLCPSARTVVKATKKRKAIVFCSDKVMPSTSTSHVEDLDSPAKVEIKLEDDMEEAKVHVGPEVVHP